MKNKKLKIILASLIVLAVLICGLFFLKSAYAFNFNGLTIDMPSGSKFLGEGTEGVNKAISTVFNLIITISEIAFVLLFLIGGVMYLSSMGDEEGSKKAKKLLTDAVIGLVIVLASWAIGTWVINQLTTESENIITSPTETGGGAGPRTTLPSPQGTETPPPTATTPTVSPT